MQVLTETFLKVLFDGVDKENYIDIRTFELIKDEPKPKFKEQFFERIKDIDRLTKLLNTDHFKNLNVHFGVCPRYRKGTGTEKDVKVLQALYCDIDCKRKDKPNLPTKEEALQKIKEFKIPPSIIIDSGQGYHLYWLLSEPINIKNNTYTLHLRGMLAGLSKALGGDIAGKDLCRCLRVPNTFNFKPDHNGGLPVKIIKFEPDIKYDIKQFKEFHIKQEEKVLGKTAIEKEKIKGWISNLDDIVLPDSFKELLKSNKKLKATWNGIRTDLADTTKSGYSMSLTSILVNRNTFTDEEIIKAMIVQPNGKLKDNDPEYLLYTLKTAKGNFAIKHPTKFNVKLYSEKMREKYNLIYDYLGRFWYYSVTKKIWKLGAEKWINAILREEILKPEHCSVHYVNEVINELKGKCFKEEDAIEPPLNLIPFNNVIFDLDTDKTIEYSPKYFFISKWAVNYNPQAPSCKKVDEFLNDMVEEKDVITLKEFAAYPMWGSIPNPRSLFLYGGSRNGKSQYERLLTRIYGKENMAMESMTSLAKDKFAAANLYGKALNIASEENYSMIKNDDMFKRITGQDLIRGERKFKEPFYFYNKAKSIFVGNIIRETADTLDAFFDRTIIVKCPYKFVLNPKAPNEKKKILDIIDKLPEIEIEGFALCLIVYLKKLRKRDWEFTNEKSSEVHKAEYLLASEPLSTFLETETIKNRDGKIQKRFFWEKYNEYLTTIDHPGIKTIKLGTKMRDLGYGTTLIYYNRGKEHKEAWSGINWKSDKLKKEEEELDDTDKTMIQESMKVFNSTGKQNIEEVNGEYVRPEDMPE